MKQDVCTDFVSVCSQAGLSDLLIDRYEKFLGEGFS